MTRWVGIDEAGYGPNLGPLVLSAVTAEGSGGQPPDLWTDRAATICRAGGKDNRLWVDDSKLLYRGGTGLARLEAATLASLAATVEPVPKTVGGLLEQLKAGSLVETELQRWLEPGFDPPIPQHVLDVSPILNVNPFDCATWRLVSIRSVVLAPEQFNRELALTGSKARVHFAAFARLLKSNWDLAEDGAETFVRSDKHGGRHFYYEPLLDAFPDAWIDRGPEGPALSRYTLRSGSRRLTLELTPRADAFDGLVALASIVSKTVREYWMQAFNAYWGALVPGLRPCAGYPVDAARFRQEIEETCTQLDLKLEAWWRAK